MKLQGSAATARMGTTQRLAKLDQLDDESVEVAVDKFLTSCRAPRIIMRFYPEADWLWRQWRGTVLESTWRPALPDPSHPVVQKLRALENL
ncbi:MAG: hypothetical protein SGPRY_006557, partial [Prymnesium sp.]